MKKGKNNLRIYVPITKDDIFTLELWYDSRKWALPNQFTAFCVYLNNDSTPFAELKANEKKIYSEQIDFTKYLKYGHYKIKISTCVSTGSLMPDTLASFILTVGDYKERKMYPWPPPHNPPPLPPGFPEPEFPEPSRSPLEFYNDEFEITYGH